VATSLVPAHKSMQGQAHQGWAVQEVPPAETVGGAAAARKVAQEGRRRRLPPSSVAPHCWPSVNLQARGASRAASGTLRLASSGERTPRGGWLTTPDLYAADMLHKSDDSTDSLGYDSDTIQPAVPRLMGCAKHHVFNIVYSSFSQHPVRELHAHAHAMTFACSAHERALTCACQKAY
jgi:hypothetical protein